MVFVIKKTQHTFCFFFCINYNKNIFYLNQVFLIIFIQNFKFLDQIYKLIKVKQWNTNFEFK